MLFSETERRPSFTLLLDRAMRLLAQRDHSAYELSQKIRLSLKRSEQRNGEAIPLDEDALQQVISHCQQNGWLDDQRFAERFIVSRSRNGYGPQRIQQDLQQKGLEREDIHQALAEAGIDWTLQAAEVVSKKYGEKGPVDIKEKAKAQRFLHSRGFLLTDIRTVLANFDH